MLRSQRRGRDPPCWLSEKEPLVGKRRVNFQRCWLPVSRIGLHRRGVERVNCGPKLLDLGEKGVYSSYTSSFLFDSAQFCISIRSLYYISSMKSKTATIFVSGNECLFLSTSFFLALLHGGSVPIIVGTMNNYVNFLFEIKTQPGVLLRPKR